MYQLLKKIKQNRKSVHILSILTLMIVGAFLFVGMFSAETQAQSNNTTMSGYAWSSNIGWISTNCVNTANCEDSPYKVNVDSDGNLSGYAWSSNIGWIKFGGLSSFPIGGIGTTNANAKLNENTNRISGWIRAVRPMTPEGQTLGDWDGWISLSGTSGSATTTSGSYGITAVPDSNDTKRTLSGYSWGSDVIGWINWNGVEIGNEEVVLGEPIVSLYANPDLVTSGGSTTLAWSSMNTVSCSAPWTSSTDVSGAEVVSPSSSNIYSITCTDSSGKTGTASVSVTVSDVIPDLPTTSPALIGSCVIITSGGPSYQINQPISYRVMPDSTYGGGSYAFEWTASPVASMPTNIQGSNLGIVFLTTGLKNVSVKVTENTPGGATGTFQCPEVKIEVNPTFIEE